MFELCDDGDDSRTGKTFGETEEVAEPQGEKPWQGANGHVITWSHHQHRLLLIRDHYYTFLPQWKKRPGTWSDRKDRRRDIQQEKVLHRAIIACTFSIVLYTDTVSAWFIYLEISAIPGIYSQRALCLPHHQRAVRHEQREFQRS